MSEPAPTERPRTGSPRDRHGRGPRGPLALPSPVEGSRLNVSSRRDRFDAIVSMLVDRHLERWGQDLRDVEFGTEDVPELPADWGDEPVPFGALVKARPGHPARIVVFRRPVEMRAKTRLEQIALVNEILVEHLANLLGRDVGEIDP